ncbi:MAG: aspartate aminotransferase family protein [Thermoplasmatota archaeon]
MLSEGEIESGVLSKRGIEIVRGEGCRIWDSNGVEYLDMGASLGVCNVGHRDPEVLNAINEQAGRLLYVSSSYDNPVRKDLMEKLISISPQEMSKVFLCNSGTESVEAALKFAFHLTGRKNLVAAKRAFHGRTFGSLSLTFNPTHRKGMDGMLLPVDFVSFGDIDEMNEKVNEETAAVILEPVQGEGGVHIPPEGYMEEVRRICDENGVLLIIDEVQAGLCRTGKMFAIEHHNVVPDIMCVGKSLGGGLPIAATLLNEGLGSLPSGLHGSTFGGDPLACAAANGCLRSMIDQRLDRRANELGKHFIDGLKQIESPLIRDVRGQGLMIGVELKQRTGPYLSTLLERGITALPTGATVIRFLPPLVVTRKDIDRTVDILSEVLDG